MKVRELYKQATFSLALTLYTPMLRYLTTLKVIYCRKIRIFCDSDLFLWVLDVRVDGLAEVLRELPRPLERLDVLLRSVQDGVERHEVAGVHLGVEGTATSHYFPFA